MLSQPENMFNFRHMMDDGMIFIADLSSNLGTEIKQIIGGFILALMCITALSRSDIPQKKRRPFNLYLDEVHLFVTDKLENILVEARKFNVRLNLALFCPTYSWDRTKATRLAKILSTPIDS